MALLSAVAHFTANAIWTGTVQMCRYAVSVGLLSLVLWLSVTQSLSLSSLWEKYDVMYRKETVMEQKEYCIIQLHAGALWVVGARSLPSKDCFHSNLAVQHCLHTT